MNEQTATTTGPRIGDTVRFIGKIWTVEHVHRGIGGQIGSAERASIKAGHAHLVLVDGDGNRRGATSDNVIIIPAASTAPIAVAVEDLRSGDVFALTSPAAPSIAENTVKILEQARINNLAGRDGANTVRRIFLRGRAVEITTMAMSTATAMRGTLVCVVRPTAV